MSKRSIQITILYIWYFGYRRSRLNNTRTNKIEVDYRGTLRSFLPSLAFMSVLSDAFLPGLRPLLPPSFRSPRDPSCEIKRKLSTFEKTYLSCDQSGEFRAVNTMLEIGWWNAFQLRRDTLFKNPSTSGTIKKRRVREAGRTRKNRDTCGVQRVRWKTLFPIVERNLE